MKCVCCFIELEPVAEMLPETILPEGGIICYSQGNTGSVVLDPYIEPIDVAFVMCDRCLSDRLNRNIIVVVSSPSDGMPPTAIE